MRVSKMTVYRLVHAQKLAAVSFGRSIRIPVQAVKEYVVAERRATAPAAHTAVP